MAGSTADPRVNAWTIATQARLGTSRRARAGSRRPRRTPGRRGGKMRSAAAVIRSPSGSPPGPAANCRRVLGASAPVSPGLHSGRGAAAGRAGQPGLGDERASRATAEQALKLAEPDRLVLPFAMTGARQLLEAVPEGTSHVALVADILDAVPRSSAGRAGPFGVDAGQELSPKRTARAALSADEPHPARDRRRAVGLAEHRGHPHSPDLRQARRGDRTSAVQRGRELRLLSVGRT